MDGAHPGGWLAQRWQWRTVSSACLPRKRRWELALCQRQGSLRGGYQLLGLDDARGVGLEDALRCGGLQCLLMPCGRRRRRRHQPVAACSLRHVMNLGSPRPPQHCVLQGGTKAEGGGRQSRHWGPAPGTLVKTCADRSSGLIAIYKRSNGRSCSLAAFPHKPCPGVAPSAPPVASAWPASVSNLTPPPSLTYFKPQDCGKHFITPPRECAGRDGPPPLPAAPHPSCHAPIAWVPAFSRRSGRNRGPNQRPVLAPSHAGELKRTQAPWLLPRRLERSNGASGVKGGAPAPPPSDGPGGGAVHEICTLATAPRCSPLLRSRGPAARPVTFSIASLSCTLLG